jgi:signal transduction histidine kinase
MRIVYDRDGTGHAAEAFFDVAWVPYDNAEGSVEGIIAVTMEVTELVRERRRSQALQREAEEANAAKSQFLSTMSHEIRTPINAMLGYTQLLDMGLAGPISPGQREYLDRLRASSEHLLALVNDVLDLAKVDAGRLTVATERGVAERVVDSAIELTLPLAEAKGVRLGSEREGGDVDGVAYLGDEHRVRQILVNLLTNAIKFTPAGGTVRVVTSVGTSRLPATGRRGRWACISVTDTGVGIDADNLEMIFEPFRQVEANDRGPYRRTVGGTGLGLAISRRLARLMGGDLVVESEVGKGSTFTLCLPAATPGRQPGGTPPHGVEKRVDAHAEATQVVHGLAAVGDHLRQRVPDTLADVAERLRAAVPPAKALRRAELDDHQGELISSLTQTLIVLDETGGLESSLQRDGARVQRLIAELHGRQRQRHGWTDEQLAREFEILGDAIEEQITHDPGTVNEHVVDAAIGVARRIVARAAAVARRALHNAAQGSDT